MIHTGAQQVYGGRNKHEIRKASLIIPEVRWRRMKVEDLLEVDALGNRVHVNYPEDFGSLKNKFVLYPRGCFTLESADFGICGYCISHPWTEGVPPKLNTRMREIPENATAYFVHDIAIDEKFRGRGLAQAVIEILAKLARKNGFETLTGVSVNNTTAIWRKVGFENLEDTTLQEYVKSAYGKEAVIMRAKISKLLLRLG